MSALLDISRIDSGALRPQPAPFAIGDLLKKVEVEFGAAGAGEIDPAEARRQPRDRTPTGCWSAASCRTSSPTPSSIPAPADACWSACRRHGARVRLDVIDTGIGFSASSTG